MPVLMTTNWTIKYVVENSIWAIATKNTVVVKPLISTEKSGLCEPSTLINCSKALHYILE